MHDDALRTWKEREKREDRERVVVAIFLFLGSKKLACCHALSISYIRKVFDDFCRRDVLLHATALQSLWWLWLISHLTSRSILILYEEWGQLNDDDKKEKERIASTSSRALHCILFFFLFFFSWFNTSVWVCGNEISKFPFYREIFMIQLYTTLGAIQG